MAFEMFVQPSPIVKLSSADKCGTSRTGCYHPKYSQEILQVHIIFYCHLKDKLSDHALSF